MPGYVIGNFFVYALINALTPRPGNILALNTVTNYGWKKETPMFFGIFSGYYVVQLICAIFVYSISTLLPGVLTVIKYASTAYILWLAIHIALSRPDQAGGINPASFWKGFVLQIVNIKIYLFGITTLTGYVINYSTAMLVIVFFSLVIATIGSLATTVWIGAGMMIQNVYLKHYRPINIILAVALLECVYSILK